MKTTTILAMLVMATSWTVAGCEGPDAPETEYLPTVDTNGDRGEPLVCEREDDDDGTRDGGDPIGGDEPVAADAATDDAKADDTAKATNLYCYNQAAGNCVSTSALDDICENYDWNGGTQKSYFGMCVGTHANCTLICNRNTPYSQSGTFTLSCSDGYGPLSGYWAF
jgi:hypothetical protein